MNTEWIRRSEVKPFKDNDNYTITVRTSETTLNKSVIPQAKINGLTTILDFFNKDTVGIETLANDIVSVPADGIFLEERPQGNMLVLVVVSVANIERLPNKTNVVVPTTAKVATVNTSTISKEVEFVSKLLVKYQKDLSKQNTRITPKIIFSEEAERLKLFLKALEEFLTLNNERLDSNKEDIIQISLSSDYKTQYVTINGKLLATGLSYFKESFNFPLTLAIISYLPAITNVECKSLKDLTWKDFMNKYVPAETVSNTAKNFIYSQFHSNGNSPTDFNGTAVRDVLRKQFDELPYKTETERFFEEQKLNNENKQKIVRERDRPGKKDNGDRFSNTFQDLKDPIFSNITDVLGKIKSLDDAYSKFFNKTSITDLSESLVSCLLSELSYQELLEFNCLEVLSRCDPEEIKEFVSDELKEAIDNKDFSALNPDTKDKLCAEILAVFGILGSLKMPNFDYEFPRKHEFPTLTIPDNLPVDDILGIVKDLIEKGILALIGIIIIELIRALLDQLLAICRNARDDNTNNYGGIPLGEPGLNEKVINDMGIPSEALTHDTKDFFDDISVLLLPTELCDLLRGDAQESLMKFVHKFIEINHPTLFKFFPTIQDIIKFFVAIRNLLDRDICSEIEPLSEFTIRPTNDLCGLLDVKDTLRDDILNDRATPQEIDKQIKDAKNRRFERIKVLNKIRQSGGKNVFDDVQKSLGCNKLIPTDPAPILFANDLVTNTLFKGVIATYESDVSSYTARLGGGYNNLVDPDLLKQSIAENKPVKVGSPIILQDMVNIINAGNITVNRTATDRTMIIKGVPQNHQLLAKLNLNKDGWQDDISIDEVSQSKFEEKTKFDPTEAFADRISHLLANFNTSHYDNIHKILKNEIYDRMILGIGNRYMKTIAESPILKRSVLASINFLPKSLKEEDGCNQNGIIRFEDVKNSAKKRYADSACDRTSDNEPFVSSSKEEAVLLLIKIVVLESILKSMICLSTFRTIDLLDSLSLELITRNAELEISLISGTGDDLGNDINQTILKIAKKDKLEDAIKEVVEMESQIIIKNVSNIVRQFDNNGPTFDNFIEMFFNTILLKDYNKVFDGYKLRLVNNGNETFVFGLDELNDNKTSDNYGEFIIQQYIRTTPKFNISEIHKQEKDQAELNYEKTSNKSAFNVRGIAGVEEWNKYINNVSDNKKYSDWYSNVFHGIRLIYVLPKSSIENNPDLQESVKQRLDIMTSAKTIGNEAPTSAIVFDSNTIGVVIGIAEQEQNINEQLNKQVLIERKQFAISLEENVKELFVDVLPANKILSLILCWVIKYVGFIEGLDNAFINSKRSLQSLLTTLMNSKNYDYQDPANTASPNDDDGSNPLGFKIPKFGAGGFPPDLATLALMTPLLILKGLADLVDPSWPDVPLTPIGITQKLLDGLTNSDNEDNNEQPVNETQEKCQ